MSNPAPITGADIQAVLRASGWLTQGQAWDLAAVLSQLLADFNVERAIAAARLAAKVY